MARKIKNPKQRKEATWKKLYELLSVHSQILIVSLSNVSSFQVQSIRKMLGARNSKLLIGKNTIIRKVVQLRAAGGDKNEKFAEFYKKHGGPIPQLSSLAPLIKGKVGLIFTDELVFDLKPALEANKLQTAARWGVIAPIDVIIPPGSTGLDPAQISFFHALSISTKINKGQIELTKEFKVCTAGNKVSASQAALLQKLNIKPFLYGMKVLSCYDDGNILDDKLLSLQTDQLLSGFNQGVKNLTALSLEAGIPTELTVPNMIVNSFKNLAAIGLQINYQFEQLKGAQQSQPAQEVKKVEKKEEKPKEEPKKVEEKVEEVVDFGGMFGDD